MIFHVSWDFYEKNENKKVKMFNQPKVVPNNQYISPLKKKSWNFVILLLKVGHHFNID